MRSVTEIQDEITLYEDARAAVLKGGESFSKGGFSIIRPNLGTIEKRLKELRQELALTQNGGVLNYSVGMFRGRR